MGAMQRRQAPATTLIWAASGLLLVTAQLSCRRRLDSDQFAETTGTRRSSVRVAFPGAPGSFVRLVKRVTSTVVHISTDAPVKNGPADWFSPGASSPVAPMAAWNSTFQQALGSGVLLDGDGYILTTDRVIGDRSAVWAQSTGGSKVTASVVGRDPRTNLALLRAEAVVPPHFKPPSLGSADDAQIGEWVLALANPLGVGVNASVGIISSDHQRRLPWSGYGIWSYVQTNLQINAGNRGAPLFNTVGEVIGIATTVAEDVEGVGFAIPIDVARRIVPVLKTNGRVERGWAGVYIDLVSPESAQRLGLRSATGALVAGVVSGGPGDRAGLRQGDVILSAAGARISTAGELAWKLEMAGVGRRIALSVWRSGKPHRVILQLDPMPE